jgi:hypothetical protein
VPIGVKILAPDSRDSVLAAREALRLLGPRRVDEGEVVGGMSKKAMLPRLPPPPNAERASRDNGIYSPPIDGGCWRSDVGSARAHIHMRAKSHICCPSRARRPKRNTCYLKYRAREALADRPSLPSKAEASEQGAQEPAGPSQHRAD